MPMHKTTMKTVLLSGGSGSLGKELVRINKHYKVVAPSSAEMYLCSQDSIFEQVSRVKPDIFLHCGALTKPMSCHDENPQKSIQSNILGTSYVTLACIEYGVKLVYISTDYVYPGIDGHYQENDPVQPINKYAWSKIGGECAVQMYDNSLILRVAFLARPFLHPKAFTDAYKSNLYHDEIAPIILQLLDKDTKGILNVGGERKSIYEFAKQSKNDVQHTPLGNTNIPKDISMDTSMLKKVL